MPINPRTNEEFDVNYYGVRCKDSIEMHKTFSSSAFGGLASPESYRFKFPPNMNVIEAMSGSLRRKRDEEREFKGMNPLIRERQGFMSQENFKKPSLEFESKFESGNLDMAIQIRDMEYDIYMRVDSNTRGHHQWFNFIVSNHQVKGRVKFNIVNFTKNASLYHQGMRISIFSQKDFDHRLRQLEQRYESKSGFESKGGLPREKVLTLPNDGWVKGGENIQYKISKLSQIPFRVGSGAQE